MAWQPIACCASEQASELKVTVLGNPVPVPAKAELEARAEALVFFMDIEYGYFETYTDYIVI